MQQLRTRRRNPEVWLKANRFVVGLILLALVAFVAIAFHPELARHQDLVLRLEREREKLQAQELENARLKREQHLLQNDPEYVETIARDALGVMKPDEEIIRLDSPGPPKSGATEPVAP